MHKFSTSAAKQIFSVLLFAVGLVVGCTDGDDNGNDEDGGTDNTARIASTCQSYCAKAHTCDDSKTVEQCVADCKANLGDCMVDEQGEALDDLDGCAAESCDDFGACTIGAGLQCTFGI